MNETAEPDETQGWSPDEGQARTVLTSDYRYKDSAGLILMKMPERPAPV